MAASNHDSESGKLPRRQFLRGLAAAGPAACVLSGLAATAQGAPGDQQGSEVSPGLVIREKEPENLEFPFSSLSDVITPNERHYIRSHFKVPEVEVKTWRLKIEGAVDKPLELSYDELLKMPSTTLPATLECAGNSRVFLVPGVKGAQWELGGVSTSMWTGVPLAALLARAGVRPGAVDVVLEGADEGEIKDPPKPAGKIHFARSLPLEKARQGDVILAYRMNGKPLPGSHGFPLRAVVPGWYAVASVKWLSRIVVTERPFDGYYQTVDYAYWKRINGLPTRVPLTELQIKAEIARPEMHEVISAGTEYRVHGAAWSGTTGVAKVEVSTDGGATYAAAKLLKDSLPYAWRLWEFTWHVPAKAGRFTLLARATDEQGNAQPLDRDRDRENYMINQVLPIDVDVE